MRMSVRYAAAPRKPTIVEAANATAVTRATTHHRRRTMAQYSRSSTIASSVSLPVQKRASGTTVTRPRPRFFLRRLKLLDAHELVPVLDGMRAAGIDHVDAHARLLAHHDLTRRAA